MFSSDSGSLYLREKVVRVGSLFSSIFPNKKIEDRQTNYYTMNLFNKGGDNKSKELCEEATRILRSHKGVPSDFHAKVAVLGNLHIPRRASVCSKKHANANEMDVPPKRRTAQICGVMLAQISMFLHIRIPPLAQNRVLHISTKAHYGLPGPSGACKHEKAVAPAPLLKFLCRELELV